MKPISQLGSVPLKLDPKQQELLARHILEGIRKEIRRDTEKAGAYGRAPGEPVPIPRTKKFEESFQVRATGGRYVITSDWPTADAHVADPADGDKPDPTPPFEMTWLTQPSLRNARIVTAGGQVIVRVTPQVGDAWIHPGFRRYSFVDRGVKRGTKTALQELLPSLLQGALAGKDFLR